MTAATKWCRGCIKDLPREAFGRRAQAPDGLAVQCRECARREAKFRRSLKEVAEATAADKIAPPPADALMPPPPDGLAAILERELPEVIPPRAHS